MSPFLLAYPSLLHERHRRTARRIFASHRARPEICDGREETSTRLQSLLRLFGETHDSLRLVEWGASLAGFCRSRMWVGNRRVEVAYLGADFFQDPVAPIADFPC